MKSIGCQRPNSAPVGSAQIGHLAGVADGHRLKHHLTAEGLDALGVAFDAGEIDRPHRGHGCVRRRLADPCRSAAVHQGIVVMPKLGADVEILPAENVLVEALGAFQIGGGQVHPGERAMRAWGGLGCHGLHLFVFDLD